MRLSSFDFPKYSSCLHVKGDPMKKADDKLNGVRTFVTSKTCEYKEKSTRETRNLESTSSSYNTFPENAETKVNMKAGRTNKLNHGPNMSGDAEKSSPSSGEEHSKPSEQEMSLQSDNSDDDDESDVVEHDVKVCDICGDAGREYLLAICCRCPDGAEHTYCMKVMRDKVPEGDWLCDECESEEIEITNPERNSTETEKDQSSDAAVVKVSGKRHAQELESSSSFKKQALGITGSSKDVDRGKLKSSPHFGKDSSEGPCSPSTRPRLQSLQGSFTKSSSFSLPNSKPKTKLVDEIVLQRQKSTKERSPRDRIAAKEMSKSVSFRSTNMGRLGPSSSKVKMLSPNIAHVQDHRSLLNKKERGFERTNSVKLNTSSSAAFTPKGDKLLSSRGETNSGSPVSNSEAKPSKVASKITSGLKLNNRSVNIGAEPSVSQGQTDKQLPSSPTRVGTVSPNGVINSVEAKSIDNSSKGTSKESTNLADGIKETTNPCSSVVPCQNNRHSAQGSLGSNIASAMKIFKDLKKGENKLKDAIEAAMLKKPGVYRKNKVSDEPSVPSMSNEAAVIDRVPHSRNAGSLTSAEVSPTDHSKQSNGNSFKPSMQLPADVALPSLLKNPALPGHECIWQGGFEINRSGKTAEFWDGLQAHLSICASPRVSEAVNKFPHKILLNGVSRVSAWPTQFENSGVKEDNIALYFFAKDHESYEKRYLVLLDDMIKSDLALIGSINGVELLIFPSNQLPERSNRWNMLFFLWGVFRGKKKKSSHQIPNNSEKRCAPQSVSSISTDRISLVENANCAPQSVPSNSTGKISLAENGSCAPQSVPSISTDKVSVAENASLIGSVEKDKHVSESKVNPKWQNPLNAKATDSVNVVPASSKGIVSESIQNEPKKRPFIDLSEDVDDDSTNQINTWRDVSGRMVEEEGSFSKKQKSDSYGQTSNLKIGKTDAGNSNSERYVFPVDLNEDITNLVEESDNMIMTKNDDDDVGSLSLSLAFCPPDKG